MAMQTEQGQKATQTPTEALAIGTDAISEDQKGLDLATDSTSKPVVDESAKRLKYLEGRVNGLQSIVDKQTDTLNRYQKAAQDQEAEAIISRLPEDQQEFARFQQQKIDALTTQQQLAAPTASVLDANTASFVQTYGISTTDPRLDLAGYQEGTAEGTKRFMDSIYAISNAAVSASVPDNMAPPNQQVTPPSINAAPPETGGGLDTEEAINIALTTGQMSHGDYIRRRQQLRLS